jgi:hypothetical protein
MSTVLARDLEPWCELVRSEFGELPGLRLTLAQAQRLWSIDAPLCRRVLQTLLNERFLSLTDDGQYCRADCIDGAASID